MGDVLQFKDKSHEFITQVAALAWKGFLEQGRGMLVYDMAGYFHALPPGASGVAWWYVPLDSPELDNFAEWNLVDDLRSFMESYNPEVEFVAVGITEEKAQARVDKPVPISPPDAYKKLTEQNRLNGER
jgi:hypothetical protein